MKMESGAGGRGGCVETLTIDRTSSIDNEPRTLHIDQIECAREAALYVMNTSSIDDALRIFTEGLQPAGRMRISEEGDDGDDDDDGRCEEEAVQHHWDNNGAGCGRGAFEYGHHHLHRRSTSAGLRDIATAPF